jgi:leucyl/phenylalanyl-tRNA---protein transferase
MTPFFQPLRYLDPLYIEFPNVELARPDGLLAVGGDLRPARLLLAYSLGIFPWFQEDNLIFWFAPYKRFVLPPSELYLSKSLKQTIRRDAWRVTLNHSFGEVIRACATTKRPKEHHGTWIDDDFIANYTQMHHLGWAHSVEVWQGDTLVGGLYGIIIGNVFSGESMFAKVSNASKVGFAVFVEWLAKQGITLIDCQTETQYLASFGAKNIWRDQFMQIIEQNPLEPLFKNGAVQQRKLL